MNALRVPVVMVVGGLHRGQHSPPGPSFSVHGPVLSLAFQTHAVQAMVDIHSLYTGRSIGDRVSHLPGAAPGLQNHTSVCALRGLESKEEKEKRSINKITSIDNRVF